MKISHIQVEATGVEVINSDGEASSLDNTIDELTEAISTKVSATYDSVHHAIVLTTT